MWKVLPDYKVLLGGLYFLRPRTLIARAEPDGTETPLLTFERGEDGILTIAMQFLNRDGDVFGHVRPGCAPVPSKLLAQSANKEKWRITSRDTGALVCGIERTWGLDWATLEVSFNMWIHGRPVKISPKESNVPEIVPAAPHADPLPECGLRFHKGVSISCAV